MRIDHHAYQRATRVAGVGFLAQLGIGLVLLIFSLVGTESAPQDTAMLYAALYVLLGLLAWLGLLVVFNQHKLERLEALEEDELAATREGRGSVFEASDEDIRVAGRRLRLMHKWFMPTVSLVLAAGLGALAWLMLRHLGHAAAGDVEFRRTESVGWAVAICLAFASFSFIVSRFVAGMAKQPAWQNLRGGAAYMVGNALVTLAVAVGMGFRFFRNDDVIVAVAYAIPIFMIVMAAEIILNFILNLYRPRIPGETPRPAFDSKVMSLFAAPDNLVRSINEAVNYQFGFDITSSWGYQLLIRSFAWLLGVGVLVMLLLNMIVIVEPHQQAIRLSRGAMVGEDSGDAVHRSGVMWKLPWPLQTSEIYDVTTVRELHLTGRTVAPKAVELWADELGRRLDKPLDPLLVGASRLVRVDAERDALGGMPGADETDARSAAITENFSLIDSEIVLHYRIREDGGLLDYLDFSSDEFVRQYDATRREHALKAVALRGIALTMSKLSIDEVLADRRVEVPELLRASVQEAFDLHRTGIELTAVALPILQPAGEAAPGFEELNMAVQARQQYIAAADEKVFSGLAQLAGNPERARAIIEAIDAFRRLVAEHGADAPQTVAQRVKTEHLIMESGGRAAQIITDAERDRWVGLLGARTSANRLEGQIASYRAAPRLFRERETMRVYAGALTSLQKYVLCVDPARVSFDVDLKELNPLFGIGDAFEEQSGDIQ